jgi:hypothetical protein
MPRVWNKRDKNVPAGAEYVGRPTLGGNPFSHLDNTIAKCKAKDRHDACVQFRAYAIRRIKQDPAFKEYVKSLCGKDLVCWCVPAECHATILMELSEMIHRGEL